MIAESALTEKIAASVSGIDERHALRHPLQIALCLRGLASHRDFLTVEFGGAQLVTQVLDVDSRRACFLFDLGGVPERNAALLRAETLVFRSQPSGIRTEFVVPQASMTQFEGRPAFEAAFPALLYYVQRREFYRVETPLCDPFTATGSDPHGEAFTLDLQDISLGGVALRTADTRFADVERGTVWRDITLDLHGHGEFTVDLEIVAPRQAFTPTGERRTVLGCRFMALDGIAERTVQRVIAQLETRNLRRTNRD